MVGDLFTYSGPHSGRNAPETSRKAAGKFMAKHGSIRQRVHDAGHSFGSCGFVDEDLEFLAPDRQSFERSFRPRRTELANERWFLDTGKRQEVGGNQCVVWIHRDFLPNPPALLEKGGRPAKKVNFALVERAEIVDWLRNRAFASWTLETLAELIENGAHTVTD